MPASHDATGWLVSAAACSIAVVDDDGGTLEFVASDGAGADEIVGVTIPVSCRKSGNSWTTTCRRL